MLSILLKMNISFCKDQSHSRLHCQSCVPCGAHEDASVDKNIKILSTGAELADTQYMLLTNRRMGLKLFAVEDGLDRVERCFL